MNSRFDIWKGIGLAALSALCWSTLFPAASYLLAGHRTDPMTLTSARYLSGSLAMLLGYTVFTRKNPAADLAGKDWAALIFHGFLVTAMSGLLFMGSARLPVVNASMLEAEAPLLIFVLGILFLKNRPSGMQFSGLVLGFAGCMFVLKAVDFSGIRMAGLSIGDLFVWLGALFWALYTVLGRTLIRRIGGVRYSGWTLFFGGLWALPLALGQPGGAHLPETWSAVAATLYVGLVPTALAFFAWNNAQRYVAVGLLAISGYFTPALAAWLALALFGEAVTGAQILGMVLVVGSSLIEPDICNLLKHQFQHGGGK